MYHPARQHGKYNSDLKLYIKSQQHPRVSRCKAETRHHGLSYVDESNCKIKRKFHETIPITKKYILMLLAMDHALFWLWKLQTVFGFRLFIVKPTASCSYQHFRRHVKAVLISRAPHICIVWTDPIWLEIIMSGISWNRTNSIKSAHISTLHISIQPAN